jgi:hypothetical protein
MLDLEIEVDGERFSNPCPWHNEVMVGSTTCMNCPLNVQATNDGYIECRFDEWGGSRGLYNGPQGEPMERSYWK